MSEYKREYEGQTYCKACGNQFGLGEVQHNVGCPYIRIKELEHELADLKTKVAPKSCGHKVCYHDDIREWKEDVE